MRWLWIDKFVEFERGRRAVAIKNVSIVEEEIDDYVPGFPIMPNTLIIEGMAQTAGLLIGEYSGFSAECPAGRSASLHGHGPGHAQGRLHCPGDELHRQ
jgi:3-hydroxyacyl-[acyl-carrier-protein] dehydratase